VCYGGNFCVQLWDLLCWVLHGIRAEVQGTFIGRYFTAGGQWYCRMNGVCYSEHDQEYSLHQVDNGNAAWMKNVTVKIICKILHSRWTVVLQLVIKCVTVNIIWKILYSRGRVVLQLELSVLQWVLYASTLQQVDSVIAVRYKVRYSEHYLQDTLQHVDSVTAAWMECVTVNIIYKILYSR